ncbi:MAG: hypothetical protein CM15mP14_3460 [Rhodospirillaceae bacterium]|nr:MAG: hypothetical protein CM15mP14_3460 [Rhodospirillaceae bacterium]
MIDKKFNNAERNIEYIIKTPKKSVIPRSEKKKKYVGSQKKVKLLFQRGQLVRKKPFLLLQLLCFGLSQKKKRKNNSLLRPAVEAGERLGFFLVI